MKFLHNLYKKIQGIFTKGSKKNQPQTMDQIAHQEHQKVLQDSVYKPQEAINRIQKLIKSIDNNSHITQQNIIRIHFSALYICQHMERIPNNMIRGKVYNEYYPNPYSRARFVQPYTNPTNQQEKNHNKEAKERNKSPKDLSAHYLKINLQQTIKNIQQMVANGIEYFLGKDVLLTSKSIHDIGLDKYTCKPIKSLTLRFGDYSSVSDQLDNLKYHAVADGGNALVNLKINTGKKSKKGSPTGSVSADLINVKEKHFVKGHYQKDFLHDQNLLENLKKKFNA